MNIIKMQVKKRKNYTHYFVAGKSFLYNKVKEGIKVLKLSKLPPKENFSF